MGKSRIMWDNLVSEADSISATASDQGYPVTNIANWRENSIWQASEDNTFDITFEFPSAGVDVTSFCLMGHNLNTQGARYKLQGSDNPGGGWTDLTAYSYPGDDFCKCHQFTLVNYSDFRIRINNDGGSDFSPQIGIVFLGEYMEIPLHPFHADIDPDKCMEVLETQRSESGILLGSSIAFVNRNPTFSYPALSPTFINDEWLPFRKDHRGKPFFWNWDSDRLDEVYLMEFAGRDNTQPYNQVLYRSLSFTLTGRKEE